MFLALVLLYWAFFVPCIPLGIATFEPGLVTWASVLVASYALGHAAQGVANKIFPKAEKSALDSASGKLPSWLRKRAQQTAAEILKVNPGEIEPGWVFRTLDEYALQTGKDGDRDIFVYREGFYRGTALSLFFLSAALLVRLFVPGSSIQFTRSLVAVSHLELMLTALIVAGVGYLFLRRYQRFAEYRITRSVLAALVMRRISPDKDFGAPGSQSYDGPTSSNPNQASQPGNTEANG